MATANTPAPYSLGWPTCSGYVVVAAVVLAGMLLFVAAMAARRLLAPARADGRAS